MKLDLGCGNQKKEGYIGVDAYPDTQADVLVDLEKGLPFKSNSIDKMNCSQVMEHVSNFVNLLEEIWRVLKFQGTIDIEVPYFKSRGAYENPAHVRFFGLDSFDLFGEQKSIMEKHYSKVRFRILERRKLPRRRRKFIPFKNFFDKFLWEIYSDIFFRLEKIEVKGDEK